MEGPSPLPWEWLQGLADLAEAQEFQGRLFKAQAMYLDTVNKALKEFAFELTVPRGREPKSPTYDLLTGALTGQLKDPDPEAFLEIGEAFIAVWRRGFKRLDTQFQDFLLQGSLGSGKKKAPVDPAKPKRRPAKIKP